MPHHKTFMTVKAFSNILSSHTYLRPMAVKYDGNAILGSLAHVMSTMSI